MMSHIPSVSKEFPIHWAIWHNNLEELHQELSKKENDKEKRDPRGRSPLHLAVALGHIECVRVLLRHDADVTTENKGGWTVIQEATSTGDPELVQVILQHRDHQRATARIGGIPELLEKLRQAPDFYVEMRWEFTSWVPLMSRMCPSDTYRVWKSGPNVRIDTTLIGFDNMNWVRGSRSYIFQNEEHNQFEFMEIDHDNKVVYSEMLELQAHHDISRMQPSEDAVAQRLTSPVSNTFVDTDKIEFTRAKAGIWGWRHDKVDEINGYECKVFSANNVQLVTKSRTEHLTKEDKDKVKADGPSFASPLQSLLGVVEQHEKEAGATGPDVHHGTPNNPTDIRPEEYFNEMIPLEGRDIGRPKELTTKVQKFRANMWLSENHPLSLQEQVLPIIDLMAISNAHFAKLRDFITLQLPAGFPVKIEIPLFHVINACVTFGNLYAKKQPVTGVTNEVIESLSDEPPEVVEEGDQGEGEGATPKTPSPSTICVVDQQVFDIPEGYARYRAGQSQVRYGEDELLQLAIQQSLLEQQDEVGFVDALGESENLQSIEDKLLERAIAESLLLSQTDESNSASGDQQPGAQPEQQQLLQTANHTGPTPPPLPPRDTITEPTAQPQPITNPPLPARGRPAGCMRPVASDDELRLALEISERERMDVERRRKEEEEELQRIIELSLTEK